MVVRTHRDAFYYFFFGESRTPRSPVSLFLGVTFSLANPPDILDS